MTPERKQALIGDALARVQEILETRLDAVGERTLTIDEIEDLVEEAGREAEHWLEGRLIDEQEPAPVNRVSCPRCHQPAFYKETVPSRLLTTHGEQTVRRRYYRCPACAVGFAPLDRVLDLGEGRRMTRRLRSWLARWACDEGSFAAIPPLLAELRGLVVSESTVERTTVEVGTALAASNRQAALAAMPDLNPELQAATPDPEPDAPPPLGLAPDAPPVPAPAPAARGRQRGKPVPGRLYLGMDGTSCPIRDVWRRDGTLGKLVCHGQETKIGMAFTTYQKDGLDEGIHTRAYVATLGKIAWFTVLMVALARAWGAFGAKELVVLGDGAAWIWNLTQRYFPKAVQILDLWHVLQRLQQVAAARFGSTTDPKAQAWLKNTRWRLENDHVDWILTDLRLWEPQGVAAQELRAEQLHFLEANQGRMRYGTYLEQGYYVGSGVVESSCKRVVQSRLHEAGMHWREHTAEAVLAIRAYLLSDRKHDLRAWA